MNIASFIDATLLKPDATASQIDELCRWAIDLGCASVCVNPVWIPRVAGRLSGSGVKTCGVVGFPMGANTTGQKLSEIKEAVSSGASEVDMVMNLGWFKGGDLKLVQEEILAAAELAHRLGAIIKVIIETSLLSDQEIMAASRLVRDQGADFVKTSTGFGSRGASVHDIELIRAAVGETTRVKASGGIKTPDDAMRFLAAGADRLGVSAYREVITGWSPGLMEARS